MKIYASLAKRYREQPNSEVFAHMRFNGQRGETWETPYQKLAEMAKPEEWNFSRPEFRNAVRNYPILVNYLNFTFLRLQELGRWAMSSDGSKACFNTGLQTPDEKDIYATFFFNQEAEARDQPDWILFGFLDSYSDRLTDFRPLPGIATYIDDASDLVFDLSYELETNYPHIINENEDRLPPAIRGNRTLAISAIEGATKFLKEKTIRNYKVAIPQWHAGKIQLLLPLNLTSRDVADLALVADKDKAAKLYRIRTALPMDAAYSNARLITRPDRDWLNP